MPMRRALTPRIVLAVLAGALLTVGLLGACGSGQETPREALESLRTALAAGDGARVAKLHDPESRGFYRSQVREVRARLARGDAMAEIFPGGGPPEAEFTDGSEEDALARFVLASSEIAQRRDWLAAAEVVGEEREDDSHARLRLRNSEDAEDAEQAEQELFFVRTMHGWTHDAFRQFRSR